MRSLIFDNALALASLRPAVEALVTAGKAPLLLDAAVARGHFRPAEDERLMAWFGRFLSIRMALWDVIDEARQAIGVDPQRIRTDDHRRCFLLAYAAACLVVALDRHLTEEVATDAVLQRKLNEGDVRRRIPRKQFTAVWKSLGSPANAWAMFQAMEFARQQRGDLEALADDVHVGTLVADLPALEAFLDPSKRGYWRRLVQYREHSLRRRWVSGAQRAGFAMLESSGRMVSELRDQQTPKRVEAKIRRALASLLQPGDVIVTRHDRALSNLFLPGYWPHAALYIGSEDDRLRMDVRLDAERSARWQGPIRVLEARKDGVRLRTLDDTLGVDAVAVLRPRLNPRVIAEALGRALQHEGKGYNFDFDFFRADRLVCTEVVYRAYDGIEGITLPLAERAGRPTLAAEDLLDLALDSDLFDAIAVFGADTCSKVLVTGPGVDAALAASYR